MKEFTVIMPVYIVNEELLQLTKNAVESFGDVNLVVVDNNSSLGGGYLRSVSSTYIRNSENLGFAKACNQGLVLARLGTYICVFNNDIRLSPNWQGIAKEVFTGNDKVFSCHFRMLPYDEPFKFGDQTWYTGKERWCTGSQLIFNKDQQLFLYDEQYLNSYEDWSLYKIIRDQGLMTAYTNKACFQHKDSSTQVLIPERVENEKKNRELFKKQWGEYAEDLFARTYPEQMKEPWRPFP